MNDQNSTEEALAPSMNQMRDILSETISSLRLLSNQPRDVIFSGINSGINFNNNAQLLSFGDIFNLLGLLLSVSCSYESSLCSERLTRRIVSAADRPRPYRYHWVPRFCNPRVPCR